MIKLITACALSCTTSLLLADSHTVGGYTYNYSYSNGGINIRPVFDVSSHNTALAVRPQPTGDYVIPSYLPDGETNYLPVVNIGYQPRFGQYAGTANAFSSSAMTSVVIPNTVTNIDRTAFANCTSLEYIKFPTNLISIGYAAFANCPKLVDIVLPDKVKTIGSYAFGGCTALEHISLPIGVKSIGQGAFGGGTSGTSDEGYVYSAKPCTNLTSITIPSSVTNIGASAFQDCVGLRSVDVGGGEIQGLAFYGCLSLSDVTLGDNVTYIGDYVFGGCTNLIEIVIPDSVTHIGDQAFRNCYNLRRVTLGNGIGSIGSYAFKGCTNLVEIVIPNSVTNIGAYAFEGCANTRIVLGSGIKTISSYAFANCAALEEVVLTDVRTIGERAFNNCSGLQSIVLGDDLTNIGRYAFNECSSLVTVKVGGGVIDEHAFLRCRSLTTVTLGDNVTQVGDYAFSDTQHSASNELLSSVTLGTNISKIGICAFAGCKNLTSIILPEKLKVLGMYAFAYTAIEEVEIPSSVEYLYYTFNNCTNLTNVVIHSEMKFNADKVERIGVWSIEGAFLDCSALVSVSLPDTLTNMTRAFSGCKSLKQVNVPESIVNLGADTFINCSSLEAIEIPANVTNINGYAFYGCSGLTNIVFSGNAPMLGSSVFTKVHGSCVVKVGRSSEGWNVNIPGIWNGLKIEYLADSILPDISETATIPSVFASFADEKLIEGFTGVDQYEAFRDWAYAVTGNDGERAGAQAVKESPYAWQSFALGVDKLIDKDISSDDIHIVSLDAEGVPSSASGNGDGGDGANVPKLTFEVEIDGVEIGKGRVAEKVLNGNLKNVLGIEGATELDEAAFSSGNLDVALERTAEGKAKATVTPNGAPPTFFIRVKVK